MNNEDISDPLEFMKKSGKLISPTGDLKKENLNPLGLFSCKEVLEYLPYFCEGKLGKNKLILMKLEKHLKEGVSNKCGCSEEFSRLKK